MNNPFFGICLSLAAYEIGVLIQKKTKSPCANPLLLAILICIIVLQGFNIPLSDFMQGGMYITFFIAPATVCLVIPLYKQIDTLKKYLVPILVGVFAGTLTSLLSMVFFVKIFHLDLNLGISIIPKAITTAIGMDLSSEFGGIPAITAATIILTGILGAILAPGFLKLVGVDDEIATGVAMGTSAHAVGTSRAMELGELQGAMAGLCIGIAGIFTAILMPVVLHLL